MRGRLSSLQALRGVAVGAVLLFHLRHVSAGGPAERLFPDFWVHLQAGVDLFFVISGYVMVYTSLRPSEPPLRPLTFLRHRARRIYPLYWLVTIAIVIAVVLAPRTAVLRAPLGAGRISASLLLWPQSSSPILGQGWSLVHEMYFYVVFALILAVASRWPGRALLAWGLIVLAGSLLCGPFSNSSPPLIRTWFHPLTFEFIAGAALALAHNRGLLQGARLALLGSAALTVFALRQPEFPLHGWSRVFAYGGAALLLLHGLVAAERSGRPDRCRWLETLGDASYSIYLVQMSVLVASLHLLRLFVGEPESAIGQLMTVGAAGLAALVIGIAVWRWIERPLQRAVRKSAMFSV